MSMMDFDVATTSSGLNVPGTRLYMKNVWMLRISNTDPGCRSLGDNATFSVNVPPVLVGKPCDIHVFDVRVSQADAEFLPIERARECWVETNIPMQGFDLSSGFNTLKRLCQIDTHHVNIEPTTRGGNIPADDKFNIEMTMLHECKFRCPGGLPGTLEFSAWSLKDNTEGVTNDQVPGYAYTKQSLTDYYVGSGAPYITIQLDIHFDEGDIF